MTELDATIFFKFVDTKWGNKKP